MSVNPVGLCADLQAWHGAGLSFLYFSDIDAAALLKKGQRQFRPAAPEAGVSSAGHSVGPALSTRAYSGAAMPGAAENAQKTAISGADFDGAISENFQLPEAWAAIARQVKSAPVIWTYKELGEDLLRKGDPGRSKALKELIGSLGLKGGTSSFLPTILPGCPEDGSQAWCFSALLDRLNGRVLVVLGAEALALGPYAGLELEPFHEKIVQGRMIICLPQFSEILAHPARFEATRTFLRSAFAKINISRGQGAGELS